MLVCSRCAPRGWVGEGRLQVAAWPAGLRTLHVYHFGGPQALQCSVATLLGAPPSCRLHLKISACGQNQPAVEMLAALQPLLQQGRLHTLLVSLGVLPDTWLGQLVELAAADLGSLAELQVSAHFHSTCSLTAGAVEQIVRAVGQLGRGGTRAELEVAAVRTYELSASPCQPVMHRLMGAAARVQEAGHPLPSLVLSTEHVEVVHETRAIANQHYPQLLGGASFEWYRPDFWAGPSDSTVCGCDA